MPYSLDFRQKVINFVENGGTITKQLIHLGEEELRYIDGYLAQNCQQLR